MFKKLLLSLICWCLFATAASAAANSTAVWRVRPSGSDTNGGGFDCYISSAATGSNGSWATISGTTTFTDTTAAAFTSGMVGSSINIPGVGQYSITGYTSSTQITITTPASTTSNIGSAYSWAVGAGQDYSQQNSAQVNDSGTANTSTATTTLTDTGASFTSALVGNAIYVSGTSITTTLTYITAVPTSTTLTLQTSPGTAGTAVTYHIGGGWADFWTNASSSFSWVQPGNIVYILGGSSPSYASPDYTRGSYFVPASGNATAGLVKFVGDPNTPSTNGYGGRPLIKCELLFNGMAYCRIQSLWFVAEVTIASGVIATGNGSFGGYIVNCVLDQDGYDIGLTGTVNSGSWKFYNCEVFSSAAKISTNANYGVVMYEYNSQMFNCNIHNCIGSAVLVDTASTISGCIIANNATNGITISSLTAPYMAHIFNNTINANGGSGIVLSAQTSVSQSSIFNNIISNNTSYGITASAGTTAANSLVQGFINHNCFYNNNSNYNAIGPGSDDVNLASNPYTGQSTQNYTLNTSNISYANAFPNGPFNQNYSGNTTGVQSYIYPGAIQPTGSGGGSAQIFSSGWGF